jgi:protein gp37
MQPSNISWCDYTWNPQTGCSRIGPICYDADADVPKCYAERFSNRQGRTDQPWTHDNAAENVSMHHDRVDQPDDYTFPDGPGTVFVGSMTDMFHSETDPGFVQNVLDVCRRHREQLWIWLTKRPHRAAEWRLDWPSNCMLGVSVGSSGIDYPSTTHRIEQLRDVDVEHKWVSFEPLLEPVGDVPLDHIEWVVVGGESHQDTKQRRDMDHTWARDILQQSRAADVPFYFKQDSGPYPESSTRLTVHNHEFDVFEQRQIREGPPLPEIVAEARQEVIEV